jgi:hypothetical protein
MVDTGSTDHRPSSADVRSQTAIRLRLVDSELSFFSTLSTFGTAADITLAELSIEAFYPSNAGTAARLLEEVGAG